MNFKRFTDQAGYLQITGPYEAVEYDTANCVHCQHVIKVSGGDFFTCRSCYAPICPDCANKPCDHFEKKLARYEARQDFLRDIFGR